MRKPADNTKCYAHVILMKTKTNSSRETKTNYLTEKEEKEKEKRKKFICIATYRHRKGVIK